MAKKSKTVDLKPKADKISDEQLTQLQNLVSNVNKIKFEGDTPDFLEGVTLYTNQQMMLSTKQKKL